MLNVENESRCGLDNALIVQTDFANLILIRWKTKESPETMSWLRRCLPPLKELEIILTDNSKEFIKAGQHLQWNHDASTEWQKEPSAEWKKEHPSQKCKADYQKNGGTVQRNAIVTCATCTTRWPLARQHSRRYMAWNLTDLLLWNTGWVHPNYREGQVKSTAVWKENAERNTVSLCATCGRRLVKRLDDGRQWRCARIGSLRNLRQMIHKQRSICEGIMRISVRKRNLKTS